MDITEDFLQSRQMDQDNNIVAYVFVLTTIEFITTFDYLLL